jgi:hypothetical protein
MVADGEVEVGRTEMKLSTWLAVASMLIAGAMTAYYDRMFYLMSLMHLSGEFRIIGPK